MENGHATAEYEAIFFADAETVTVEVSMLRETYEEILRLATANGWPEEEAVLTILAHGLGYAKAEQVVGSINCGRVDNRQEVQQMAERLADIEAAYTVMKFRSFNLMKDNQALELREAALRNSTDKYNVVLRLAREEKEELKQQLAEAQAASPPMEARGSRPDAVEPQRGGVRAWLRAFLS